MDSSTAYLVFGSPHHPSEDRSKLIHQFWLTEDEDHNVKMVQEFFDLHQRNGNPRGKQILRTPIAFLEMSSEYQRLFGQIDSAVLKFIQAETVWGESDLNLTSWNPLHLAAFLNHKKLATTIIQLDGEVLSYKHHPAINCIPDARGRLPLDIAFFVHEFRKPVDSEFLALLSPVCLDNAGKVRMRADNPKESTNTQLFNFCIVQLIIALEIGLYSNSDLVRSLCGASVGFAVLVVVGNNVLISTSGRENTLAAWLAVATMFLTIILLVKYLYANELIDYSVMLLGVANVLEDWRTLREGMPQVCEMYGRRQIVPEPRSVGSSGLAKTIFSVFFNVFAGIPVIINTALMIVPSGVLSYLYRRIFWRHVQGDIERWVDDQLEPFSDESPDKPLAKQKVNTFVVSWFMTIASDLIFVAVGAILGGLSAIPFTGTKKN